MKRTSVVWARWTVVLVVPSLIFVVNSASGHIVRLSVVCLCMFQGEGGGSLASLRSARSMPVFKRQLSNNLQTVVVFRVIASIRCFDALTRCIDSIHCFESMIRIIVSIHRLY